MLLLAKLALFVRAQWRRVRLNTRWPDGVVMVRDDHAVGGDGSPRTRQQEAHADARRERLVRVARDLFVRQGFEATTMAEIARRAKIAVGTLYKLFDDKISLYHHLIDLEVAEYERALVGALATPPDDERCQVENYIEAGAHLFVESQDFARLYFSETRAAFLYTSANLESVDSAFGRYLKIHNALVETFERGIRKQIFIDMPPRALAQGLEGLHNTFLGALVREPDSYTADEITNYVRDIFFKSVLR